eukprot:3662146-Rhodomonas_salina.1
MGGEEEIKRGRGEEGGRKEVEEGGGEGCWAVKSGGVGEKISCKIQYPGTLGLYGAARHLYGDRQTDAVFGCSGWRHVVGGHATALTPSQAAVAMNLMIGPGRGLNLNRATQ